MITLAPHYNFNQHITPRRQSSALYHQPSSSIHSVDPFDSFTSSTSNPAYRNPSIYNSRDSSSVSSQQSYYDWSTTSQAYHLPLSYNTHNFNNLSINVSTPMQSAQPSGSWNFAAVSNGQLTPTSARTPRNYSHHRESSLSSIGSAGPSSPFNASTANPHIILSENDNSYYEGLPSVDGYHNYSKPLTPHTSNDFLYGYNDYNHSSNLAAFMALQKQQGDTESMPAPDYSHARSVASTHDSPATPVDSHMEFKNGESPRPRSWLAGNSHYSVPKLDRTMSDVYNDELYSPNFAFTSAPASKPTSAVSPSHNDVFTQRLQAANNQHLSATSQSPLQTDSRQLSPFRQGSPLAPTHDGFGSPQMRLGSAHQIRQQQKAESDAMALAQQIKRSSPQSHQSEAKTISPKDALLDYHGNDDASEIPLFQPTSPTYRPAPQMLKTEPSADLDDSASLQSFRSMATSRRESSSAYSTSSQTTPQNFSTFAPLSVPGVQIPQQYPFVPQPRREQSSLSGAASEFPSTLTSMESSSSDYTPDVKVQKPSGAAADTGTYTCTYHGCTLRFETPAKLQKHKREGHRQSQRVSGSPEGGMTSAANRNSQAGPHRCDRINPSTGKPCNTVFSRPYDLTRHEATIHAQKKAKIRCEYCTDLKEFSRADALTRHMRVVHPEKDFQHGKQRRRD